MKTILFSALVLFLSHLCFADTTIVQKVESGPIMGQPATNTIQTMKIKGTKARIDHQNTSQYQIMDLAAKKVYMVNPDKKEAMVMGLDMMNAAGAMFKQMNQNAQLNVKNTGNTRTVNGFKCTDYVVSATGALALESKQCVTTDVDYTDFEAFRPYAEGFMKMFLGESGTEKLPQGMSVVSETTMNMMGQKVTSRTELQSVKKGDIPAADFEVPAEYKTVAMPAMKQ
jgi:hypothetical protein